MKSITNVTINGWYLKNSSLEGIGNFIYHNIKELAIQHPEVKWTILVCVNFEPDKAIILENIRYVKLFPKYRNPFVYLPYFIFIIPIYLFINKTDIFIGTDGNICFWNTFPQISIIHDISFFHRPQDLSWYNNYYYNSFYKFFAKKANLLATVSEYSKLDIALNYKVNPNKIDVISSGLNGSFVEIENEVVKKAKRKYTNEDNYFISIGAAYPRKNLPTILSAFDKFKSQIESNMKLLLVGNGIGQNKEIMKLISNLEYRKDIILTGRISNEELNALLHGAYCTIFIPFMEGFGLPILESMSCGVPVICSNITSLPEISGGATLLVNPFEVNEVSSAMIKIYISKDLRDDLIEKGKLRSADFSWSKTSELLYNAMEKCIETTGK